MRGNRFVCLLVLVVGTSTPRGGDRRGTVYGAVPRGASTIVWAKHDRRCLGGALARAAGEFPAELRAVAALEATRVGERLPRGAVYTADKAPVEWLIDRSIVGYAAEE